MRKRSTKVLLNKYLLIAVVLTAILLIGFRHLGSEEAPKEVSATQTPSIRLANPFPATLQLSSAKGKTGTTVHFRAEGVEADKEVQLNWQTVEGSYEIKGVYEFTGAAYKDKTETLLTGKSDSEGKWEGDIQIPEGFGGNHTLYLAQNNETMSQSNFFINPSFTVSPASGPVGTEITVTAEGLGSIEMESNWQLTYDNKLTGLISAVSTNGKAVAKIRAAGPVGDHSITLWHGYMGMPYLNHQQAPNSYLPVPTFAFEVTEDKPVPSQVEAVPPSAANGGVEMPELQHAPGVNVQLDKAEGNVGDKVTLQATGLPANQKIDLVWNTMVGSRVSGEGFGEKHDILGQASTDRNGALGYVFQIPDDLGGVPHRIDLKISDRVLGQAYVRIIPSIVRMTPTSGKAGTEIVVELKGVGWTEYDNTFYITYDNAYVGYVCGFNTNGDVKFTLTASGSPGYHIIDLYPGIYKGEQPLPDIYNAPQLTYWADHPGTAIPAIRLGFELNK